MPELVWDKRWYFVTFGDHPSVDYRLRNLLLDLHIHWEAVDGIGYNLEVGMNEPNQEN